MDSLQYHEATTAEELLNASEVSQLTPVSHVTDNMAEALHPTFYSYYSYSYYTEQTFLTVVK